MCCSFQRPAPKLIDKPSPVRYNGEDKAPKGARGLPPAEGPAGRIGKRVRSPRGTAAVRGSPAFSMPLRVHAGRRTRDGEPKPEDLPWGESLSLEGQDPRPDGPNGSAEISPSHQPPRIRNGCVVLRPSSVSLEGRFIIYTHTFYRKK